MGDMLERCTEYVVKVYGLLRKRERKKRKNKLKRSSCWRVEIYITLDRRSDMYDYIHTYLVAQLMPANSKKKEGG